MSICPIDNLWPVYKPPCYPVNESHIFVCNRNSHPSLLPLVIEAHYYRRQTIPFLDSMKLRKTFLKLNENILFHKYQFFDPPLTRQSMSVSFLFESRFQVNLFLWMLTFLVALAKFPIFLMTFNQQ